MTPYLWMMLGCFFTAWMGQFAHLLHRHHHVDWRIVALARTSLALVLAIGLAKASGAKLVFWRPGALWVRGCSSSISLLCTFFAFQQLKTSEVLTLTNTFPIWVAFLSWPMMQVRPTLSVWLAAAFGVAGVALMQSTHFDASAPAAGDHATLALILCMVAALTNAIAMLGLNRLKGISSWAIVVHYSGVATLFVLASWTVGPFPDVARLDNLEIPLLLASVGLMATLGQICITRAFTASAHPDRVSVVGLTQVVFALALDLIFETSSIQPVTIAGICLVLAPTAWMMADRVKK